ncbi:unnamed protein product, partial [Ostreobium quekettii]
GPLPPPFPAPFRMQIAPPDDPARNPKRQPWPRFDSKAPAIPPPCPKCKKHSQLGAKASQSPLEQSGAQAASMADDRLHLNGMPTGVLHKIFHLLGPRDLSRAGSVCRLWRALNRDDAADCRWRALYAQRWPLAGEGDPICRWQAAYGAKVLRTRVWRGKCETDSLFGHKAGVRCARLLPERGLAATGAGLEHPLLRVRECSGSARSRREDCSFGGWGSVWLIGAFLPCPLQRLVALLLRVMCDCVEVCGFFWWILLPSDTVHHLTVDHRG